MNEIEKDPIEYKKKFESSVGDLSAYLVKGFHNHLNKDLNNWDQLGVCVIVLENLITDLSNCVCELSGGEPFSFNDFIEHLLKMNEARKMGFTNAKE